MRLWRRRERVGPPAGAFPAVRLERVVVAMATHAAQLADRVERLETRMEEVEDTAAAALASGTLEALAWRVEELTARTPDPDTLIELRLESHRLAAEVARLTAELGEQSAKTRRLEAMADAVIDLTHATAPSGGTDGDGDDWAASA